MAVISVTYEEPNPTTYKSVGIHYSKGDKEFASGNFVKDWYEMLNFVIQELSETEYGFCYSSSVDHFIMDGAPFDSAILKFYADDTPYLKYRDANILDEDDGIEFFVPRGTVPTWEELKKLYK
jgi:hypothetical protein